ncbi:MAG: hypothetical protein KAH32_03790 [Chlamydiia bacterium]|nr:hypothetical protein [Chlamydiia bacterium]
MRDVQKIEHTLNIRAGISTLNINYGLSIDEYDYLDIAVGALNDIRNFGIRPFKTFMKVDKDGYLDIPCNLDILEGVISADHGETAYPDREILEKRKEHDDTMYSAITMRSVLNWPVKVVQRIDGQLSFKLEGNRIFVYDELYRDTEVCIVFIGFMTDEEGFPLITRKQANALAAIAARNILMKAAVGGDKVKMQMLEVVSKEATRLKQAASIPESISDKELDEMMDVQTAFNRKRYGRPNRYTR